MKVLLLIFFILIFSFCKSQIGNAEKNTINGILYFSYDKGKNWINTTKGLPNQVKIGLGGIATAHNALGIATKDSGVYIYNFRLLHWENIPTDKKIIDANIGAIAFTDSSILLGTQFKGVFYSKDKGKSWKSLNTGLTNFTIRRFCEFEKRLYVCTNDGFYLLEKNAESWHLEYGQPSMQTNGATFFKNQIYLATNKGIFTQQPDKSWINSSPELSMHNISSGNDKLFAMTYNKLLLSSTDGKTWSSFQNGMQKKLYTFNVLTSNGYIFAGQWDGVYKRSCNDTTWKLSSNGLPINYAVTNMKAFNEIIVISTSESTLK